ncbi:MAG TPA: hypothetical protein VNR11_02915 [Xanthobacteraceae bacterium]|nr:hypothetical protein [Xanthobacteraceae bacterium]
MPAQSSVHFYLNWAKERIDEMDAVLASLEGKTGEIEADLRTRADRALADLREKRDDFQNLVKKQSESNEAAWISTKAKLDADWGRFEADLRRYVESFGKHIRQQQSIFQLQADAQLKAWRDAADSLSAAAQEFATERRGDIDATVTRMKAEAGAAEERLRKLSQAGTESWSVLMTALNETRAVFDRANQSAREAFKKAAA